MLQNPENRNKHKIYVDVREVSKSFRTRILATVVWTVIIISRIEQPICICAVHVKSFP